MHYLVVCHTEGKYYLLLTPDKQQGYAIAGFTSKEDVMKSFEGFTNKWYGMGIHGMCQPVLV